MLSCRSRRCPWGIQYVAGIWPLHHNSVFAHTRNIAVPQRFLSSDNCLLHAAFTDGLPETPWHTVNGLSSRRWVEVPPSTQYHVMFYCVSLADF